MRALVVAGAVMVGVGCGSSAAPTTPTAATSPPAGPGAPVRTSLCTPPGSTPGTPVADPNGPYFHRTVVARTADGVAVEAPRVVLDHASVPDGVRAPDGRELVYYVNGEDAAVWVAALQNDVASVLGPITLDGVPRPSAVVDPDVSVVDGRIRMAYLSGFGLGGAVPPAICLADSSDGLAFTSLGAAYTMTGEFFTDPSIVPLPGGGWLMALSAGQQTVLTRSADGRSFVPAGRVTFGGVPELAVTADGRLRLYVCAAGIVSYVSRDEGATWTREATVVPGPGLVCDPSMVAGTTRFIYKIGA